MVQSTAVSRTPSPASMMDPQCRSPPPSRDVARPVANLGNTCYMNAVLQALAHAPELCLAMDVEPHYVTCPVYAENAKNRSSPSSSPLGKHDVEDEDEEEHSVKPTRKSKRANSAARRSPTSTSAGSGERKYCTLCEVERHLRRVHADSHKKDKPVSPSIFVYGFIDHVAPWFKLGQQEDSHEFLRLLIDAMQRSCKESHATSLPSSPPPSDGNTKIKDEESDNKENNTSTNVGSPVTVSPAAKNKAYPFQLFQGTIESQVTCEHCKTSSSTHDPIEDIGLEVSYTGSSSLYKLTDVASAFQRFAKVEALDSGYKCEKCGNVGKANKQSRLASIPPILTLHLKRFRYGDGKAGAVAGTGGSRRSNRSSELDLLTGRSGSAKVEGHSRFDPIIDLRPYLTPELQKKHSNMLCRLFAVIVHAGKNSHSGHYISYVRNVSKNEWWKMDDARVTPASIQEVLSAEAYMLFYRVVDHPFSQHVRGEAKKLEDACRARMAAEAASALDLERNNGAVQQNAVIKAETPVKQEPLVPLQATAKSEQNGSHSLPASGRREPESNRRSHNSRKRKAPEFTCGEDWAKTKTNLPRSVLHQFRDVEHIISDYVKFSPEFHKMITEQASRRSAQVGHGPSSGISPDDDFDSEGLSKIKNVLKTLFCALEGQQHKEGRSMFPPNTAAPPNTQPARSSQFSPQVKPESSAISRLANIVVADDGDLL